MKIVIVTGGFDPLHSGHIAYIKAARQLGDLLFVGLNSDDWLTRKKGQPFMPYSERFAVVHSLHDVDGIVQFEDTDNSSRNAILNIRKAYPDAEIIFANGGDRTQDNIPEMDIEDDKLSFVFGVGGEEKSNSSSWILEEWKSPKTVRDWGYYRVLHEVDGCKVKELTVEPKQSLSMQKHKSRTEYWIVTEGKCKLRQYDEEGNLYETTYNKHDTITIQPKEWHQLMNPFTKPCRVVEVQFGKKCVEEDIERKDA
jgi:cytidyltransferase-like protein